MGKPSTARLGSKLSSKVSAGKVHMGTLAKAKAVEKTRQQQCKWQHLLVVMILFICKEDRVSEVSDEMFLICYGPTPSWIA